ncbi:adenine nucleotide translocase, putative [Perkinsus marinus ATCC 50983]|uniref:Adenine nucleotide translocase, putative n=1 Tax=Perkinsus marinus (strain ATCC 50983 / TXsc) TaxID=423536 RepID=C5KSU7_PERM5|nr:adenine nucleotide translocase, putative [Perkinsus marinus ATCC 50983]EER12297.1 adenine nucleotide translocase, putative [Perkinsus marinus ATCC 50983]|eukprot:XP_002780502.1 adenine nucleotide translocase, putative [Perkinsus marinus ATCC 50983]
MPSSAAPEGISPVRRWIPQFSGESSSTSSSARGSDHDLLGYEETYETAPYTDHDVSATTTRRRARGDELSREASVEGEMKPVRLSALTVAACGSTAGATAKFVVAPLERVKILYQTNPNLRFSWTSAYHTMQSIVSTNGIRGLWKGYLMVLTRIVPYSATNYTVFDRVNTYLQNSALRQHCPAELIRFLSGNCAGASAVIVTYPLDMLRSRLASDTRGEFSSYKDAVRKIYASRGIRGIYGGMYPTLCGIVPYAGMSFMCFETLKAKRKEMSGSWTAFDRLICGGFSGLVAQSATYPFDIIRRRQQVHGGRAFPGKGVIRSLVEVARTEGFRKGLYKGLSVNWVKGPIAVAVSLSVNDAVKEALISRAA